MTEQWQAPRARMPRLSPNVTAAVLTLVILIGSAVVADRALTAPADRSNRFLPADGRAAAVWWQQGDHRSRASVEDARLHGSSVFGGFPTGLITHAVPVPGLPIADTDWWREVIAPSTLSDPSPRLRLRSVAADGIRLHAQDWGRHSMVFDPAPIELPAAVRVGSTWSDHGVAGTGSTATERYQRRSTALRPTGDRVAAGCTLVRSVTTVTATDPASTIDWREDELWCPGDGVVESRGSLTAAATAADGSAKPRETTTYRLSPDDGPAETVDPGFVRPPADPAGAGVPGTDWTTADLRFDRGDDTFGPAAGDFEVDTPLAERVSIDRSGALHAVSGNATDVATGYDLQPGTMWLHGWSHPGGSIASVASIGLLTVVSTDRRVMRAYDPYGRVRWTVGLPDLTSVAPVRAPGDRLLVTTIRGDVIMLDARTGDRVWSQHLAGPITIAPIATSTASAVGTATALTVLDPSDGRRRWSQEVTQPIAVAAVGGTVAVLTYGDVTGYAAPTGRFAWERFRDADLLQLSTVDDQLLLTSSSSIESLSATGRRNWLRPAAPIMTTILGSTILTVGRHRVTALDSHGSVLARWPTATAVVADQQLLATDGMLLAVGRTGDHTLAGVRIGEPERQKS